MIQANEIKRLVRKKENDNNELKWSDYDVLSAINEALRYINQAKGLQNSDFLEKEIIIDIDEINSNIEKENALAEEKKPLLDFAVNGVDLPADYFVLVGVARLCDGYELRPIESISIPTNKQFKVRGGKIYSGCGAIKMLYRYIIPQVNDMETDTIELPPFFKDCIVKTTSLILNQTETDVLMKSVNDIISNVIPSRRYVQLERKMPFYL